LKIVIFFAFLFGGPEGSDGEASFSLAYYESGVYGRNMKEA
jgi:hypothetical protein